MIYTEKRFRLCLVLLACNLAFIWGNSLLPGSVSGAFSDWVKALLAALLPVSGISGGGGLLRKIAHFTEFAALGMCLHWLFSMLKKAWFWPFLLGALAACVDESIQIFVPDRGPSIFDVGIDFSGVCTGIIALYLGYQFFRKKKR